MPLLDELERMPRGDHLAVLLGELRSRLGVEKFNRRQGYDVRNGDFMTISVPFTLAAVITGYILIWLIWA